MAKGLDIGTMFVVNAKEDKDSILFNKERSCYFMFDDDDGFDLAMHDQVNSIKMDDQVYIVGSDAIYYSNLTGQSEKFHRPMAKGVLNPKEEDAIMILKHIIKETIGEAEEENEVCALTSPANPIESEFDTTFHREVLKKYISQLGYQPIVLNEALAVIYSENPKADGEKGEVSYTGIGISFGAGMVNLVLAWGGKRLIEFSVSRGGDWIDQKVAEVCNISVSKVIKYKEDNWGKIKAKLSQHKRIESALEIYYEEHIRSILEEFKQSFKEDDRYIDVALDIILTGGVSLAPNFQTMFENTFLEIDFPLIVKEIKIAKDPLFAVANGALVAAKVYQKRLSNAN